MDINISANTLFHFTSNKQSLLSILSNGLYVRHSLENYESLISEKAEIVFPMTCFCDIPLSQVKRHVSTYGNYAIGLTKKWGMQNKVNPVIYTYPKSSTTDLLDSITNDLTNFFDIKDEAKSQVSIITKSKKSKLDFNDLLKNSTSEYELQIREKIEELQYTLSHFIRYIKPYEGKFYRNGNYTEKPVKFYDEREWRFTPSRKYLINLGLKDSYELEYYTNPIKRRAINIKLAKHIKLNFSPNDIRFIIVNKDDEIPEMINDLEKIFGGKTYANDLKLLGTRLISLQQIIEDI